MHFLLKTLQPGLDIALTLDVLVEFDFLFEATGILHDGLDFSFVGTGTLLGGFYELDTGDGVEELLEVFLDCGGVGALGQDLQEGGVGHEVESGELFSLALEISLQQFLALLEFLLHIGKVILQQVSLATSSHLLGLKRLLHALDPGLIDTGELFGLEWHLLGDITSCEDRLQTGPELLHLDPQIQDLRGL